MTSEPNSSVDPVATTTYRIEIGDQAYSVEITERDDGLAVRIGDGPVNRVEVAASRDVGELTLVVGGEIVRGLVGAHAGGMTVIVDGEAVEAVVLDERAAHLASAASAIGS